MPPSGDKHPPTSVLDNLANATASTDAVIREGDDALETNLRVGKVGTSVEARARLAASTKSNPYPFTMAQLAKACQEVGAFEISESTAVYYMIRDFVIIAALYYFRPYFMSNWALHILWWNVTGFFGWALFVVGHDCGHRTFSKYLWVNDLCGHICHSVLLVPFHSWRISHYLHHCNHNHVEKDESWKPIPKGVVCTIHQHTTLLCLSPPPYLFRAFGLSSRCLWLVRRSCGVQYGTFKEWLIFVRFTPFLALLYPYYLLADNKFTSGSHFNPYNERLFTKDERSGVFISVACVLVFLGFLLVKLPFLTFLDAYFVPYMIFTYWLSMVTYLQHTDVKATYYRDGEWSYLKGALSTVDRSYFDLVDHLHHDIGMSHHHIITTHHITTRSSLAVIGI